MNFIEKIRKEVSLNDGKVLETNIISNLSNRLEIHFFVNLDVYQDNYKDIFIKDIVSLGRNDYWTKETHTWKELINCWITGYGWRNEVIDYFENEIEDKNFPAEGAGRNLRIESFGGLLTCANGNHRLVGAVCWMASKYGDDAILKKVRVASFPLKDIFYKFLDELVENDVVYLFEIGDFISSKKQYIKIGNKQLNYIKFYEIKNDKLVLLGCIKNLYCKYDFINNFLLNRDIKKKKLESFINLAWQKMNKLYLEIMIRNFKND